MVLSAIRVVNVLTIASQYSIQLESATIQLIGRCVLNGGIHNLELFNLLNVLGQIQNESTKKAKAKAKQTRMKDVSCEHQFVQVYCRLGQLPKRWPEAKV